jgi:hypothetical protein
MKSLKGYVPALARLLGMTPAALYERQRALVRAGMLNQSEGRGPGSGVRSTAESVSLLIVAALSTSSLSDTETRTRDIASAIPTGATGPLLGHFNFAQALASILLSRAKSRRLLEISVSRTAALARITFERVGELSSTEFAGSQSTEPGLRVIATLAREPFREIAEAVQAMGHESASEQEEQTQ